MIVYHATEDYVTPTEGLRVSREDIAPAVRDAIALADLLVTVSPGLAESYLRHGDFRGEVLVLPNGCDFGFWDALRCGELSGAIEWRAGGAVPGRY